MTEYYIILIVLIICSGASLYVFRKKRLTLSNAKYTETSTIGDIEQKIYDMESIGENDYRHYCEIKGQINSEYTVDSPLSNTPCCYYLTVITEHYEELKTYKDKEGNIRHKWVNKSREISRLKGKSRMFISDQSSPNKLIVDPNNNFDIKITDKVDVRPNERLVNYFQLHPIYTGSIKTKYYTIEESVLIPGESVYILGDGYYTDSKELHLGNAIKQGSIGVVTTKSEEELIKNYSKQSIMYLAGSVLSAIGAIIMIVKII